MPHGQLRSRLSGLQHDHQSEENERDGPGRRRPSITINDYALEVVHEFSYLGFTVSDNLFMDAALNRRIGRAAGIFAKLAKRVWENSKLTVHTKVAVYRACVLTTLLYGSESWTLYSRQKKS